MAEKKDRCWPGYEPVKGKPEHSQGSCKPKAESKSTPSEKNFKAKRRKQLDDREASNKGSRKSAQHLSAPGAKKKTVKANGSKPAGKSTMAATKSKPASKAKKTSRPTARKTATSPRTSTKRTSTRSS